MDWRRRLEKRTGISYCRKSIKPKGIEDELDSILYQENVIREYSEFDNIEIIRKFNDIGYSGRHQLRPELIEMLEYIQDENNHVDAILFYTVDRLGRDLVGNLDLMIKIGNLVEEIIFVEEGMTNSSDYFLRFIIQSSVQAQNERITITKKLTSGKQVKAKDKGVFIGSEKPLGYIRQQNSEKLQLATLQHTQNLQAIRDFEAVQFIFWGYLSNLSLRQIANELNIQYGLTKRGVEWCHKSVRFILENGIYAGILQGEIGGKKHYNPNAKVDPLLSMSTYTILQQKLKSEKRGRKSKLDSYPVLAWTICLNCLQPVKYSRLNDEVKCTTCQRGLDLGLYLQSVNQTFTDFLLNNYSNYHVQKLLEKKKSDLYLQVYILKNELNELQGRRKLIQEFFYNDKRNQGNLLEENSNHRVDLEVKLNNRISLLDSLYDVKTVGIDDIVNHKHDNQLLLQTPFLALLDLKEKSVYIKFHEGVFHNA
ncbi:recombinase family protein [Bacillus massiliigorillae]|uniref:recombinase family protein n=1 Tax=Bacillus massiliigorillae TaxID=1243664 RepID=UPI0003A36EBE|nr:recombinase family protein [Bacillus massiliigorillae]